MIAILHDAIDCVEKYRFAADVEGQRIFQEAKHWLLADEADWPYSFESICELLDFDAIAIRRRLRVAPEHQTHPHEEATQFRPEAESRTVEAQSRPETGSGQQSAEG